MQYQKVLQMLNCMPYLSVGLDVGAGFTWMSIMLPNGTLTGKPFKIVHSDPQSRELAVTKIKEAQEMYPLKSRFFLESTGIYHIPHVQAGFQPCTAYPAYDRGKQPEGG